MRIIISILLAIMFTGCYKEPPVEYVDVPYEIKVPVPCRVPKATCEFNRETHTEVVTSLVECIIDMKHNEEICQ